MPALPSVPLGRVLRPVARAEATRAGTIFRQIGVRLWGEGAYERESVDGGATRYPVLYRVEANDVIVNKIWARNGSVAVVTSTLAGCYGSGEFPTFAPDQNKLDPRWFHWITKSKGFWEQCDAKSRGTSGKNRIRPDQFLEIEIPLPDFTEQQRIVARIEALAGRVEEARELRGEAISNADAFVTSLHLQFSGTRRVRLKELLVPDEIRVVVRPNDKYPQVGLRSFGKGLFPKVATLGAETTYKHFNKLYAGAVVLSQVKGWEGAIAVCPEQLTGWFASPEYRTFRCIPDMASPEYLRVLVSSPWFWTKLRAMTRGVGARRERTRPEQFMLMELPFPTIKDQQYAVKILGKLDILRESFTAIQMEMDALMPSILAKAFAGEM